MTGWNSKAGSNRALDSLLSDFSGIEGSAFSKPKAMSDMKQSSFMRASGAQTEPNRDAVAVPPPSDPPAPDAARGHSAASLSRGTGSDAPVFQWDHMQVPPKPSPSASTATLDGASREVSAAAAPAGLDSMWAPPSTQSASLAWSRPGPASFAAQEDDPFASFHSLSQAPRAPSRDSAHSAPSNLASAPACDIDDLMAGFSALPERTSAETAGGFEPVQARRPPSPTPQARPSSPPLASSSPACSSRRPTARGAFWDEAWVSEAQRSPGSGSGGYFAAQGPSMPSPDGLTATPPASSSTEKPLAEMRARAAKLWTSGSSWVRGIVHNPGLKVEHLRSGLHSVADHLAHAGRDPRRGSSEDGLGSGPRARRQELDWREQEWGFQAEGGPWAESSFKQARDEGGLSAESWFRQAPDEGRSRQAPTEGRFRQTPTEGRSRQTPTEGRSRQTPASAPNPPPVQASPRQLARGLSRLSPRSRAAALEALDERDRREARLAMEAQREEERAARPATEGDGTPEDDLLGFDAGVQPSPPPMDDLLGSLDQPEPDSAKTAAAVSTAHIDSMFELQRPSPSSRSAPGTEGPAKGGRAAAPLSRPSAPLPRPSAPLPRPSAPDPLVEVDPVHADLYTREAGQAGEPEARRRARERREAATHARMREQLGQVRARDEAEAGDREARGEARRRLRPRVEAWAAGKKHNVRALLSSLHTVLWEGSGWRAPGLGDLVEANAVKKQYMRANLIVHPDKVLQKGGTVEQIVLADMIFDVLKGAWGKFEGGGV